MPETNYPTGASADPSAPFNVAMDDAPLCHVGDCGETTILLCDACCEPVCKGHARGGWAEDLICDVCRANLQPVVGAEAEQRLREAGIAL